MKQRIGIYNKKVVVAGDKNLAGPNEIHIDSVSYISEDEFVYLDLTKSTIFDSNGMSLILSLTIDRDFIASSAGIGIDTINICHKSLIDYDYGYFGKDAPFYAYFPLYNRIGSGVVYPPSMICIRKYVYNSIELIFDSNKDFQFIEFPKKVSYIDELYTMLNYDDNSDFTKEQLIEEINRCLITKEEFFND